MNQLQKVNFLGIPIDALTIKETLEKIDRAIQSGKKINHVVINAWTVVAMQDNEELRKNVIHCDLINADGQSVVWAARFLGYYLPERVPGMEIMEGLIELSAERKYKCFFFGARELVVERVAKIYSEKYGDGVIAGYRSGYFDKKEELEIARQIKESSANLLFVAMPSPQKENFLFNYRDTLSGINYNLGVGGAFDVVAGVTKRAPKWMQKNGLEWFYRFLQEPVRMWRRYFIGNFQFIYLIIKEKYKNRKSL